MRYSSQVKPISYLKANAAEVLRELNEGAEPLVITQNGEAKAVLSEGGTVDQLLYALAINAKPADIPNELTVDVSELAIGEAIHVGAIELPAGVSTDVDPEESVVAGNQAIVEDLPEAGEGEGEAAAEGGDAAPAEEAAAEGDGEG